MEGAYQKRSYHPDLKISQALKANVASTIRPGPESRMSLRLITKLDHQGLRESFGSRIEDP
jgi:hypothetical protein